MRSTKFRPSLDTLSARIVPSELTALVTIATDPPLLYGEIRDINGQLVNPYYYLGGTNYSLGETPLAGPDAAPNYVPSGTGLIH